MTIAKTASELLAEYRMLSPLEQTTLQLLAFFIAPVTRTGVHEMLKKLNISVGAEEMFGVKETIEMLKKAFPRVRMGYFNSYEGINSRRV